MTALHLAIVAPFLLAIIIPVIYTYTKKVHTGWFVLLAPLALFAYFLTFIPITSDGGTVTETLQWVPSLDINFTAYVDGLGLLFALLITGIGILVVLYSIYYLDKGKERLNNFYVYLLMFMGAMLGIALSDNMIVLYIFWELTSLSSSLLISYWYDRDKSIFGARKSMLITVFGGFAMMAGFILLYAETGTFSIQATIAQVDVIVGSPFFIPAMILILLGAFTKSAQFPFHIWLPDAMEAPTPVSAYLHSATMVKAGIYLVARVTPIFGGAPEWFWIIVVTGLLTLIWGSISAVRQKDLKGILAFSTVSQLGLIMTLLGIGSASMAVGNVEESAMYAAAITTAIVHLINHATFKGSLFMAAGIIDHETGTRDIRKLGGLMAIMPITFTISLVGLASMAGIPPFNGFISKEMFFTHALEITEAGFFHADTIGLAIPIIAWTASVFTFLYCAIMFFKTFTGRFQPENYTVKVHEAPIGMLISPVILGSLVLILGVFPNILIQPIVEPAVIGVLPQYSLDEINVNLELWHGVNPELIMTIGVFAVGAVLYRLMPKLTRTAFFRRERDPFNVFYDRGLDTLNTSSSWITRQQMTGRLRDYFVYMLVFIVGILGFGLYRSAGVTISIVNTQAAPVYVYALTILLVLTTFSLVFIKERMTFIITVGVLGFIIALLFAVFSAQDLALTQLLIETVTVVILLLAFRHLPQMPEEKASKGYKAVNVIISAGVGIVVFIIATSAYALGTDAAFPPIATYFIENSYLEAGGKNMVNVILVDFRGLDTILEVLVLAIVGLAVIMVIKHRFKGGEDV